MKQIKKTICIIGASGFVGKSIIDSFLKNFLDKYLIDKIIVISRNPKKINHIINSSKKKIETYKLDISSTKFLPEADYYIYSSESSDLSLYKNNKIIKIYDKCIKNFVFLLKNNFKNKKILYVSSGSVDQKKDKVYINYNLVKKNSEKEIKKLSFFGFKISIARCFSFISEYLPLDKHFVIGNMILDGLKKKNIKIKSNYKIYRSYMYSADMVNWLIKILVSSKLKASIYNVGSDKVFEIGFIARIIGNLFNKSVLRPAISRKKIDKYVPNVSKTKKEMRLNINYDLMDSINLTIDGLKKNDKKN